MTDGDLRPEATNGGRDHGPRARRRALVVGGSGPSVKRLEASLLGEGYEVAVADDAAGAIRRLTGAGASRPDVVLVDAPAGEAARHVTKIRDADAYAAVIALGRSGSEDNAVEALEAGADDFVRKPARPRELAARIRANLRARGSGRRTSSSSVTSGWTRKAARSG